MDLLTNPLIGSKIIFNFYFTVLTFLAFSINSYPTFFYRWTSWEQIDVYKTRWRKTNTKEHKRDNGCCFLWRTSRTHHVFSFKNFIHLRLNLDYGIALCKWCHKKYHAFYTPENTSPHTLLKFFKDFRF